MTARDIAIIVTVALSLPFLTLSVHQQWSRNGTTKNYGDSALNYAAQSLAM